MQTGNTDFIYRYDLDKACFQHDMAFGKSKDSANRNHSDRFLRDKAFQIMSDTKYDGYQRRLASMVFKFFVKNLLEVVLLLNMCLIINLQMNFIRNYLKIQEKKVRKIKIQKFVHHSDTICGV